MLTWLYILWKRRHRNAIVGMRHSSGSSPKADSAIIEMPLWECRLRCDVAVVAHRRRAASASIYIYIYIYIYILAWKPAFGRLLCYGVSSTAIWRKRSDASVLSKALLMMSDMLMTESWATEVRSSPWPQCDSASG